jgi:hypothetical protein
MSPARLHVATVSTNRSEVKASATLSEVRGRAAGSRSTLPDRVGQS